MEYDEQSTGEQNNLLLTKANTVLKTHFGYSSFREGQNKVVEFLLAGRDTLAIMPTGAGKSLAYQVPALVFDGLTLVISPLISLMKDQVDALEESGIASAFLNSSLTAKEFAERIAGLKRGKYKLLYVAPERLETESLRSLLREIQISFVAVDEAHCVSQWGHDFRPSYVGIASFIHSLPERPLLGAFTATATEEVKEDIIRLLGLDHPKVLVTGFDRPNLSFSVLRGENKQDFILSYLKAHPDQAGIIYAATRKEVDKLTEILKTHGVAVTKYHAGMNDGERGKSQEEFIHDRKPVMVATNAFGMGIDKPDVRFCIHYNMPKNMESYYQEAGRAGRDGDPAECILLYGAGDVQLQKYLIENSVSNPKQKQKELKKLQQMVDFCHTGRCLRQTILQYFGEENVPERCDSCSNCTDKRETVDITTEAQKILSCVYRMSERFGAALVAEVLKGANTKKIRELGFDRLSTYGIMRELPVQEIKDRINYLIAEDYLRQSGGEYPIVKLTSKSARVLKGEAKVYQRITPKPVRTTEDAPDLFEHLRRLRLEIAQNEGLPPYIVFSDRALREMAIRSPQTRQEFLRVSGVGEFKLEKYGERFLGIIRQYSSGQEHNTDRLEEHSLTNGQPGLKVEIKETVLSTTPEVSPVTEKHGDIRHTPGGDREVTNEEDYVKPGNTIDLKIASHVITLQMYREGIALKEIARRRQLSLITIEEHLVRSSTEGYDINWDELIPEGQEALILEVVHQLGRERLKPIKEALPEEISYFTIRAVLAKNNG